MNQTNRDILAIVGRPNVGKSALFNCIAGRRIAIVHEESGVTRDRVSTIAEWRGKTFEVVDTGGIAFMDEEKATDLLAGAARRQAEVAIEMASAIVMVVDVTAGVTPLDLEIARKLRASGKPIFLAVNKVDNARRENAVAEFSEMGFAKLFAIAAIHGQGVSALLDVTTENFSAGTISETAKPLRLAIVGRPNVGKSSLVNRILKSERTIVSDIPGTTRDSVDAPFEWGGQPYVLVDTAGLKHRSKITTSVDQFGLMRAERSIRECDVAVLVLDALAGVTKQDKKIGGQIADSHRACVVVVNKWDLAADLEGKSNRLVARKAKKTTFQEEYLAALRRELFFLNWAPVLFVSAKTGASVNQLFDLVNKIQGELSRRIETPELNRTLLRAMEAYAPPLVSGKRFKIFYAYQSEWRPPTFTLFVNDEKLLTQHYRRFLTDKLRAACGFSGCPVLFRFRQRERRAFVAGSGKKNHEKNQYRSAKKSIRKDFS
jgi:GTP-binding protein